MTEAMQSYFDQVLMDMDYAALNAETTREYQQFLAEVEKLVEERKSYKVEETPDVEPEEPDDIEEVAPPPQRATSSKKGA